MERQKDENTQGVGQGTHTGHLGQHPQRRKRNAFPWSTYTLILLITVVFVFETVRGVSLHAYATFWDWLWLGVDAQTSILSTGALVPGNVVWLQPWRLLTCFFVNAVFLHYAINVAVLLSMKSVERIYGRTGYLIIYLLGGLISALVGMLTFLFFPSVPLVVGTSGAIGAVIVADMVPYLLSPRPFYAWLQVALLWWVALSAGNAFVFTGGAMTGGFLGWYLRYRNGQTSGTGGRI